MREAKFKETGIGRIPEDWDIKKIDDIKSKKPHSMAMGPFGSNITKDNFVSSGVPVIRGGNLTSEKFKESGFVFISEAKADSLKSSNASPKDIVITHRGTLGQVGIIPVNGKYNRYVVSQSQMKLSCDESIANPYFLFYFLRSPQGQYLLLKNTSTTGVPAIAQPLTTLKNILIPLPSLNEQRAIASILGSLDDKIALNRSMNSTLEAIGQALFKHWFVDFEFPDGDGKPYRSSSGEMVDSELGGVPKGWEVEKLNNLLNSIESGRRPKGGIDSTLKEGVPSIGAENINGLGFYDYSSTKYISQEYFEQMKQGIVKNEDVLLYKDGASLGRKTMFGKGFPFTTCCVNEHVFILRANEKINQYFLYFWLNQNEITENIKNLNANSAQPGINKQSVGTLKILIPDKRILDMFEKAIKSVIETIFLNCLESRNLSQIRDALLPKLMSGKIKVR